MVTEQKRNDMVPRAIRDAHSFSCLVLPARPFFPEREWNDFDPGGPVKHQVLLLLRCRLSTRRQPPHMASRPGSIPKPYHCGRPVSGQQRKSPFPEGPWCIGGPLWFSALLPSAKGGSVSGEDALDMRRRARGYTDTCRVDHGLGTQRVPLPTAMIPSLSGYYNTLMQWMTGRAHALYMAAWPLSLDPKCTSAFRRL